MRDIVEEFGVAAVLALTGLSFVGALFCFVEMIS